MELMNILWVVALVIWTGTGVWVLCKKQVSKFDYACALSVVLLSIIFEII